MPTRSFELREFFHLVFLMHLGSKLSGRSYAVKGGMCLRLFHRSPRLSQDMDLDILPQVRVRTLQNAVDTTLNSRAFAASLLPQGITRIGSSRPKQTETTQRWKISLYTGGETSPKGRERFASSLPTKVEFSRRQKKISYCTGVPDPELLGRYKAAPFAVQYYGPVSMAVQKIGALGAAGRHAARDLFDLYHLLHVLMVKTEDVAKLVKKEDMERAVDKISRFTCRDFQGQVLPYLSGSLMDLYRDPNAFRSLKLKVEQTLIEVL